MRFSFTNCTITINNSVYSSCYFVTINLVDNLDENYRSGFPRNLYITDTFNELKLTQSYTKIVNSIEPVKDFDASTINNETPREFTTNQHMSKNKFDSQNPSTEASVYNTEQNIEFIESIEKKKNLDTSASKGVVSLSDISSAELGDNISEEFLPDVQYVNENNYDSKIYNKSKQSNEQTANTVNDIGLDDKLREDTNSNFKGESLNKQTLDHLKWKINGSHMSEKLQENSHSSGNQQIKSSNSNDAQNSDNDQRVPQEKHYNNSKCNVDIEDDDSIVSVCLEEENGKELNLYYTQKWVDEQFEEKSIEPENPIIVDSKSLFNFTNKCNVNAMTIKIHEVINNRKYNIIQHYTAEKNEPQLTPKKSKISKNDTEMGNQLSPLIGALKDHVNSNQMNGECGTVSQKEKNKSESSSFSSVNDSFIAKRTSYNSVANLSENEKILHEDFVIDPLDDVVNEFDNLLGTDDDRICPLFDPKTRACFKGPSCKLEHVPKHPGNEMCLSVYFS